eukprot:Blabericola_migrator_1__8881@NODE_46_length_16830_cov_132_783392_g42_i0_p1_GENE_NODE_46_length_16830_cov_132_783392_g42_i0NODE_46_length_16830_cov_132_783392_g42_i0_p1_ORF_typecomplete_len839_score142_01zfC3HC4_2/PF13923_6/0_00023zfC3HC4/PF00097_25/0_00043zfTRAF/PF02176_18/1_2e04zfTRAF/PF02176_18/0_00013zfTRAF/PF02176_18/1_5e04zfRING_2/PF13639_6/0_00059zfrbx1/PF12678_7/0_00098ProkRING_4/PF14447_6/0_0026ProkRING_4/PF14447_6/8_8e03zfC3HC4_3/PF13920_6/0_00058zfP11/PF03854_14/0_019zfANAPC11/PF12861_
MKRSNSEVSTEGELIPPPFAKRHVLKDPSPNIKLHSDIPPPPAGANRCKSRKRRQSIDPPLDDLIIRNTSTKSDHVRGASIHIIPNGASVHRNSLPKRDRRSSTGDSTSMTAPKRLTTSLISDFPSIITPGSKGPQPYTISVCEENVIGDYNARWLCGICNSLDVNVIITNCDTHTTTTFSPTGNDHHFCHDCLALWMEKNTTCPLCMTEVDADYCVSPDPVVRGRMLQTVVRCVYCPQSPEWTGEIRDIEAHWERDCSGMKSRCDFNVVGCPKELIAGLLPKHLYFQQRYHVTLMRKRLEAEEQEKESLIHQLRQQQDELERVVLSQPSTPSCSSSSPSSSSAANSFFNDAIPLPRHKPDSPPLCPLGGGVTLNPLGQWIWKHSRRESFSPSSSLLYKDGSWLDLSLLHQVSLRRGDIPGRLSLFRYDSRSHCWALSLRVLEAKQLKVRSLKSKFSCLPNIRRASQTTSQKWRLCLSTPLLWELEISFRDKSPFIMSAKPCDFAPPVSQRLLPKTALLKGKGAHSVVCILAGGESSHLDTQLRSSCSYAHLGYDESHTPKQDTLWNFLQIEDPRRQHGIIDLVIHQQHPVFIFQQDSKPKPPALRSQLRTAASKELCEDPYGETMVFLLKSVTRHDHSMAKLALLLMPQHEIPETSHNRGLSDSRNTMEDSQEPNWYLKWCKGQEFQNQKGFCFTTVHGIGEGYIDSWVQDDHLIIISLASLSSANCRTWTLLWHNLLVSKLDFRNTKLEPCNPLERSFLLKEYMDRISLLLPYDRMPPGVLAMTDEHSGWKLTVSNALEEIPWEHLVCGPLVYGEMEARTSQTLLPVLEAMANCFT